MKVEFYYVTLPSPVRLPYRPQQYTPEDNRNELAVTYLHALGIRSPQEADLRKEIENRVSFVATNPTGIRRLSGKIEKVFPIPGKYRDGDLSFHNNIATIQMPDSYKREIFLNLPFHLLLVDDALLDFGIGDIFLKRTG